jgi:broad specificity phosphatase PhoE
MALRTRTLLLVRHGTTSALRRAAFPLDEPLDLTARSAAADAAASIGTVDAAYASPARAATETARALGIYPDVEPALADCDAGRWSGRTLANVQAEEPDALATWLTDPVATPHGGESLASLGRRIDRWLDEQALMPPGRAVAVTHAVPIKAAAAYILGLSHEASTRLDIAPLSVTEISVRAGRWRLVRWNCPLRGEGFGGSRNAV